MAYKKIETSKLIEQCDYSVLLCSKLGCHTYFEDFQNGTWNSFPVTRGRLLCRDMAGVPSSSEISPDIEERYNKILAAL